MSYFDYSDMISNDTVHISDYLKQMNDSRVSMMESINTYAKDVNTLLESACDNQSLNEAISEKQETYSKKTKKEARNRSNSNHKKIIEYKNAVRKQTLECESIINANKKYFSMSIDASKVSIPSIDCGKENMFNPKTTVFKYVYGKDKAPSLKDISDYIFGNRIAKNNNLVDYINKNKNKIPGLLKTINSIVEKWATYVSDKCSKCDDSTAQNILNSYKSTDYYMSILDKVTASCVIMVDSYLSIVRFVIRANKKSADKNINESIENTEIFLETADRFDTTGIYKDLNDIGYILNSSHIVLENAIVRLQAQAIQSINEDGGSNETKAVEKKNIFKRIIDKLIELCIKIKTFLTTKWQTIRHKLANTFNYYGRWLDKYDNAIEEKFKVNNGCKVPSNIDIFDWKPQSYETQISAITTDAIGKIIPLKSLDRTSEDTYKHAVDVFINNWRTDNDIRKSLLKSATKTDSFTARAKGDISPYEICQQVIDSCKSKKRLRNIDRTTKDGFKKVLRDSKTWADELIRVSDMKQIEKLADSTKAELAALKRSEADVTYAVKYFNCRLKVINIARIVAKDLFDMQYRLHVAQLNNAMLGLKTIMNSDIKSVNEAVTVFNGDTEALKKFVDDVCKGDYENKNPECIQIIAKGTDASNFLNGPVSDEVKTVIMDNKLSPIATVDGNLILRSLTTHAIWIYYPEDKLINCEYCIGNN